MINFNLDLKSIDQILKSPVVICTLILILIVLSVIYGISLGTSDPQIVCKEQNEMIQEQSKQIIKLEAKHAKCIADGETSCIEREQRICRDEKESIKVNCNELIDRIVKDKQK
tara:strand:- start:678 stop:1016 length:339 start_codon:yes stop_codon:yes gene_type:complete